MYDRKSEDRNSKAERRPKSSFHPACGARKNASSSTTKYVKYAKACTVCDFSRIWRIWRFEISAFFVFFAVEFDLVLATQLRISELMSRERAP
jgi:hypothetical protein